MTLTEKGNSTPIAQIALRLPNPIDNAAWREAFRKQVRDIVGERCDEAHVCILEFTAGPLGRARVVAERDFTPLRWIVRSGGGEAVLIDSRGEPGTRVVAYDCQTPAIPREVDSAAASAGLQIPPTGTLLRAQSGTAIAAVVAVPPQRVTSFADLAQRPRIEPVAKEPAELQRLVQLAATWEDARLGANPLTALRRDSALRALHLQLIELIAGRRWPEVEAAYQKHGNAMRNLLEIALVSDIREVMRSLVSTKPDQRGLATTLLSRADELADSSPARRESFFVSAVSANSSSPSVQLRWPLSPFDFATSQSVRGRGVGGIQHRCIVRRSCTWAGPAPSRPPCSPRLTGIPHVDPRLLRAARLMVVSVDAVMQRRSMRAEQLSQDSRAGSGERGTGHDEDRDCNWGGATVSSDLLGRDDLHLRRASRSRRWRLARLVLMPRHWIWRHQRPSPLSYGAPRASMLRVRPAFFENPP